jgi:hypothetical protein
LRRPAVSNATTERRRRTRQGTSGETWGTTSAVVRHGFPREANSVVEVGEVRTLFRMPDLFSLALGGGSIVSPDPLAVGS